MTKVWGAFTAWLRKVLRAIARSWLFYVVVFAVWGLVVVLGSVSLRPVNGDATVFLATKHLGKNHRIVDGDVAEASMPARFLAAGLLTPADFVGRYVREKVDKDQRIDYAATLASPDLQSRGGTIGWLTLHGLPAADVATLEVGSLIEVCNLAPGAACGAVPIEAVACAGPADTSQCWAAIRMSDPRRRRFVTLAAANATAKISVLTHDGGEPRRSPPEPRPPSHAKSARGKPR
jgi:hypothetical protein